MEPAVTGYRFSSKSEYEVPEWILLERQTDIHKIDVGIVAFIGILNGIPYRHRVRMKGGV
jgi:hypothetical protein